MTASHVTLKKQSRRSLGQIRDKGIECQLVHWNDLRIFRRHYGNTKWSHVLFTLSWISAWLEFVDSFTNLRLSRCQNGSLYACLSPITSNPWISSRVCALFLNVNHCCKFHFLTVKANFYIFTLDTWTCTVWRCDNINWKHLEWGWTYLNLT